MKKNYNLTIILGLLLWFSNANAQRYLTEVFTDSQIEITSNVVYGSNLSIQPTIVAAFTGQPPQPPAVLDLVMDVYQPIQSADTLDERPLIIYLPTGNFLPPVFNGAPTGTRVDSSVVNFAKQLAKRGYVCAVASYRLGWNPIAPDPVVRTGTILNAAYKGMQDSKAAVRFFRNDRATVNVYKIDPTRVALIGEGTGGYVALAHAYLNRGAKIGLLPSPGLDKFLDDNGNSVVDTNRVGRLDGTDEIPVDLTDFAVSNGNLLLVKGNIANNPGFPSNVNGVINLGGALGDPSWLEAGQIPLIGVHAVRDPNAPYNIGDVIVPTTGNIVIPFASGSGENVFNANQYGNNAVFANKLYNDPITLAVESRYNQSISFLPGTIETRSGKGLMPLILPEAGQRPFNHGSPWQFWNSNQPTAQAPSSIPNPDTTAGAPPFLSIHQVSSLSNPAMAAGNTQGRNAALTYIDSIQQYIHPRLVCVLGLAECNLFEGVGTNDLNISNLVQVFPNPSFDNVTVRVKDENNRILHVQMFDLAGRTVLNRANLNANSYTIEREGMKAGIYFVRIETANGMLTQKLILN